MSFEIGIMMFGEVTADLATGRLPSPRQRARETVELARLADQVGLDVFGFGEHHRTDFVGSAPSVMLAAAAERTETIRLTSAVTVLSSDDPVRVWEQFATLDLLSGGRAEIIAGRGSYQESFALFGHDLRDYGDLTSPPARPGTRCRSGSVWAAARRRRSAPDGSGCRWRWRCCSGR